MRMSREEKERSRQRIVAAAARRVRARGIEGAGVADVMGDAGLTHGGFYRHFESKDDLMRAALDAAFDDLVGDVEQRLDHTTPAAAAREVAKFRTRYLSKAHIDTPEAGCPVAALGGEVARAPDALRVRMGAGVQRILGALAHEGPSAPAAARARGARELAMMVGAVVIARATDPVTAREVLGACREALGERGQGR